MYTIWKKENERNYIECQFVKERDNNECNHTKNIKENKQINEPKGTEFVSELVCGCEVGG